MRIGIVIAALLLSGCALNPLDALKPDSGITAQVGAENVKQAVGVTAKADNSTSQEMKFDKSTVGTVDSSARKKVSAPSITADTIIAERVEVNQAEQQFPWGLIAVTVLMFFAWLILRNKKGG